MPAGVREEQFVTNRTNTCQLKFLNFRKPEIFLSQNWLLTPRQMPQNLKTIAQNVPSYSNSK